VKNQRGWTPAWRKARPRKEYDAIIVGGGGHGLATAYYLAKNHGMTRVALLEKGWIGGGNTGRNTTIIRSNYFYPESVALYDLALRLYEGLSQELNYNIMLSQRGNLTFTDAFVVRYGPGFWVEAPNHLAPRYWADVDYYAESALRFTFRTLEGEPWSHQRLARHPFTSWGVAPVTDEDPVQVERNAVNTGVSH